MNDDSIFIKLAEECGLDIEQFKSDMKDPKLVEIIANDHTEAVDVHGAFGTPTFIFGNGQSAYLKTFIPPAEESVDAFNHFLGLFESRPYIGEVKRPQPPWPKGAV